jgi:hypothetical protein
MTENTENENNKDKTTKDGRVVKKLKEISDKLGNEATWGFVCRSR